MIGRLDVLLYNLHSRKQMSPHVYEHVGSTSKHLSESLSQHKVTAQYHVQQKVHNRSKKKIGEVKLNGNTFLVTMVQGTGDCRRFFLVGWLGQNPNVASGSPFPSPACCAF